jgi:Transmembrane domain of unknown function (DUF3566)
MSAGGRPPVRASVNGSGPDPVDGSKGDATVADSTQVHSPDAEAAGVADVAPIDGELVDASDNGAAATADDRTDDAGVEQPDDAVDVEQSDDAVDIEQSDDATEADRAGADDDQADADDEHAAANADPGSVSATTQAYEPEHERAGDSSPDPIDVANRFAESAPEPASLFVRPGKEPASSAVVPEQLSAELPTLASVDEVTMPEMASMVPEPDLHLRPAFQQHQYDTVSAFRRERPGGEAVPISPSWPQTQPIAEPNVPTSDEGTAISASAYPAPVPPAPARPVPVPPVAAEPIADRAATVTPLSPPPTHPPLESPPAPQPPARSAPAPGPTPSRPAQTRRRPRRARLRLSRVDPWSVAKIAVLFSIAMAITTLITVALLWGVLNLMGVFSDVGVTVSEVTGSSNGGGVDVETMLSLSRVLKFATIIVILQAIVLTCLSTLAAFLYNASSGLVGGVEITLSEAE